MAVIGSIMISQANARPRSRAEDIIRNTISKNTEDREELEGNDTEKRGKESDKAAPKNSELTKALDNDYEYEEYYEAPIIVIKFKRDTSSKTVERKDALNQVEKNKQHEKHLLNRFTRWYKQNSLY